MGGETESREATNESKRSPAGVRDFKVRLSADWGFRGLMSVCGLISLWLIATPFFPPARQCLLNRFHLRTGSFWTWAIQQPIPAMYSGRNTTEVRNLPPDVATSGLLDPLLLDPLFGGPLFGGPSSAGPPLANSGSDAGLPLGVIGRRTINHFPTREITFANTRSRYLSDRQPKWFVFETVYRGHTLRTVYALEFEDSGVWSMRMVGDE